MTESKKKESEEKKQTEKAKSASSSNSNTLTNQMNLILILILGIVVFNVYLFFRVQALENGNVAGAGGNGNNGQEQAAAGGGESPLSIANLKAYAEELNLNAKDFEACLDNDTMKDKVDADLALGQEYGVQGTPGFFINGKFLGGAFPFDSFKEIIDKEIDGTATGNCTDYSDSIQEYCESADGPFDPAPQDIQVTADTPVMGNPDAPVTIIEFSDFECPFCTRAAGTVEQILQEYPDQVKIYFKQFPLTSIHPNAFKASEASLCAAEQGKFKEYHDKLFAVQQ